MARRHAALGLGCLLAVLAAGAGAEDGQIEINQAIALTGGVTGSLVTDPPGFPVTIRESGSYRLTSDLSNSVNVHIVAVEAADVTIDLGGYTIRGGATPGTCSPIGSATGIVGGVNLTIRNGTIRNMHQHGISSGFGARVEHVRFLDNCRAGAALHMSAYVEGVEASGNGGVGILCGDFCRVVDSVATRSGLSTGGINVGSHSIVSQTIAAQNATNGMRGGSGGVLVVYSIASLNEGGPGLQLFGQDNAIGNVMNQNSNYGITLSPSSAAGLDEFDGNGFGGLELGSGAHACNVTNGVPTCPTHP